MFEGIRGSLKNFKDKASKKIAEKELTEAEIEQLLSDLELNLLKNNVAIDVIDDIKENLKKDLAGKSVKRRKAGSYVEEELKKIIKSSLDVGESFSDLEQIIENRSPALFLFIGFNGAGKTTSLAKFAHHMQDEHEIVVAAGDTFRAASIEQLEEHCDQLDLPLIKHDYGADAAAVIYDGVAHAEKIGADMVLADTAGRSHADKNLMEELKKICRVNDPDFKFLVVDALAGNDVVSQCQKFGELDPDAIILTKIDVDKKGGAALSLAYSSQKPILYVSEGEDYSDFMRFDAEHFLDLIFD